MHFDDEDDDDYGPARFERELERRKRRQAANEAKKIKKEFEEDLDAQLDGDELIDDLQRDKFAEADRMLSQNESEPDDADEPDGELM